MIIYIPGDPVGKERPRHDPRHPERRPHTPEKTKAYEEKIAWAWKQAHGEMIDGPVEMMITAYYRIPKSATLAQKEKMRTGDILPEKRPDIDNVVKAVMDGCQGVAFKDDAKVVRVSAAKLYSEEPGLRVDIKEITRLGYFRRRWEQIVNGMAGNIREMLNMEKEGKA